MRRIAPWLLAALTALAACSGRQKMQPANDLWAEANEAYDVEAYELAVEQYKKLLDQYPFDENAEEAELRIGYAYFLAGRYDEAVAAFQDFERMHPTSRQLASVEYHRGLASLARHRTADRDKSSATEALASFRKVIDRFPDTPWAARAELRVRECREILARHEATVAAYYLGHDSLRAAEARLRELLQKYSDTDAAADVLARFARAYDREGQERAAALARAAIVDIRPDGPSAQRARRRLARKGTPELDGPPVPELLAELDALGGQASRQNAPRAVSAYPDSAGSSPRGY
jgi:outer membrane protein assembly factor BamD